MFGIMSRFHFQRFTKHFRHSAKDSSLSYQSIKLTRLLFGKFLPDLAIHLANEWFRFYKCSGAASIFLSEGEQSSGAELKKTFSEVARNNLIHYVLHVFLLLLFFFNEVQYNMMLFSLF